MENSSKKRILIIEDNAAFLNMLKIRLELNGYEVLTSMDGVEGYQLIRETVPDLVILDLALPDMCNDCDSELSAVDKRLGHKICRMIKFDRTLKSTPVLILTASDTVEDEDIARQVGADAFLVKTMPTVRMLEKIKELLQKPQYVSNFPHVN